MFRLPFPSKNAANPVLPAVTSIHELGGPLRALTEAGARGRLATSPLAAAMLETAYVLYGQ